MAAFNSDLEAFLGSMKSQEGIIVEELPRFDLESYIQNYDGRTRFDRLLFIGKTSVPLCVDALKTAVKEAKSGIDIGRYKEAWDCIRIAAPGEPEAVRDDEWIVRIERENVIERRRLETELSGYKNNLIKESIRMGNEDLGHFHEQTGALQEATEAYTRMRHDVSTMKHIEESANRLINVAIQRREWSGVLSHSTKVASLHGWEEDKHIQPYIMCAQGIAYLGQGKFHDAAIQFLNANSTVSTKLLKHITSPSDIALYGGLLALATMGRDELQHRVLDNANFRTYLEHEPQLRKAISLFVNGRYSNCLSTLEPLRVDCLLDIHMQRQVNKVFGQIRNKCIVQYFVPFSCVKLQSLEAAFTAPGEVLEDELVRMIKDGLLNARIDTKDKLLIAVRPDPRQALQRNALEVSYRYEREAKARLRRLNIIAAGLESCATRNSEHIEERLDERFDKTPALIR